MIVKELLEKLQHIVSEREGSESWEVMIDEVDGINSVTIEDYTNFEKGGFILSLNTDPSYTGEDVL